MPFACKFCIALYGLRAEQIADLPLTSDPVMRHIHDVHGYPRLTALQVLGDRSEVFRAAARLIEDSGPVIEVALLTGGRVS